MMSGNLAAKILRDVAIGLRRVDDQIEGLALGLGYRLLERRIIRRCDGEAWRADRAPRRAWRPPVAARNVRLETMMPSLCYRPPRGAQDYLATEKRALMMRASTAAVTAMHRISKPMIVAGSKCPESR